MGAKKFYISDLHFDHSNVIKFDNRPFNSVDEMNERLIENWNSVVTNGDTVYILGDMCWSTKGERWREIVSRLRGQKVLVLGNHDKALDNKTKKLFADIKDRKEVVDDGRRVILSHYPIMFYKCAYDPMTYMLCGHVHITRENNFLTQWRNELRLSRTQRGDNCGNIYNVGCMLPYMNYTPRTLDEILAADEQIIFNEH